MREPGQSCCRPCREAQGPVQARATRGLFLSVVAGCRMRRQRRSPEPWESTVQPPRSTVNAVQRGTWMQRVCRGGARGRLPGGEGFAMTLTDQLGVAGGKGATVGDEVAWNAAPVPGSAPSPKSHLHLGPSPTPPSSPAACSVPPSLKSLTHRLLHPPPGHADHVCCRRLLASDSPLSPHDLPVAGKSCFLSSHQ